MLYPRSSRVKHAALDHPPTHTSKRGSRPLALHSSPSCQRRASFHGPLLVIGYGNTLRRDDGVGVQVAMALTRALAARGGVTIAAHQLLPEHCAALRQARLVIFVDASCALSAGQIAWQTIDAENAGGAATALGHHGDPASLLALTRTLYGTAPAALLVSIGVRSLDHGYGLSPTVAAAAARVVREIARRAKHPKHARRDRPGATHVPPTA
jgi:hydrogenase maturation protease